MIVFVVTSFWAYGELLIASEFAKQLKADHDILFVIPPSHKKAINGKFRYVSLIPNSRSLNRIIITEIREKYHPELVILSDFLNYAFADSHYGIIREDLALFGCKLATFDNFDWKLERRCMDTYGFVSDIPKKVNIDDYGCRIIPCPLANPRVKRENEYRFSMVNESIKTNGSRNAERKQFLEQHHLADMPIVLVSYAKWQETYAKHDKIDRFIEVSNRLFDTLLLKLSKSSIIISVGEKRPVFEGEPNIVAVNSVPSDIFQKFVDIADLYIEKNITSTSMIRIVMAGTPCVNIINSHARIQNKDEIAEILHESVSDLQNEYRYMMYPVGWYEFLTPLFHDNPYSELIQWCELFDFYNTLSVCLNILNHPEHKEEQVSRIIQYRHELDFLPTPNTIVSDILNRR